MSTLRPRRSLQYPALPALPELRRFCFAGASAVTRCEWPWLQLSCRFGLVVTPKALRAGATIRRAIATDNRRNYSTVMWAPPRCATPHPGSISSQQQDPIRQRPVSFEG